MGLPLTWVTLSLLNMFAAEYQIPNSQYIVGGDDLLGYWSAQQYQQYLSNLSNIGLVINEKKTYESPLGGIFAENLLVYKYKGQILDTKRYQVIVNLSKYEVLSDYVQISMVKRPLLSAITGAKRHAKGTRREDVPYWQIIGDILKHEWSRCEHSWQKKRIYQISNHFNVRTWRLMRASGIPIYWPKELGGFGLPGKQDAPAKFRKAAAVVLNGKEIFKRSFVMLWKAASEPEYVRKAIYAFASLEENMKSKRLEPRIDDIVKKVDKIEDEFLESFEQSSSSSILDFYSTFFNNLLEPEKKIMKEGAEAAYQDVLSQSHENDEYIAGALPSQILKEDMMEFDDALEEVAMLARSVTAWDYKSRERITKKHPLSLKGLKRNILRFVNHLIGQWKSVKPIRATKAYDLVHKNIQSFEIRRSEFESVISDLGLEIPYFYKKRFLGYVAYDRGTIVTIPYELAQDTFKGTQQDSDNLKVIRELGKDIMSARKVQIAEIDRQSKPE